MKFAIGERNYAFAGTANKTPRIVHTQPTKPKTSPGCSPSPGYYLTAQAVKITRFSVADLRSRSGVVSGCVAVIERGKETSVGVPPALAPLGAKKESDGKPSHSISFAYRRTFLSRTRTSGSRLAAVSVAEEKFCDDDFSRTRQFLFYPPPFTGGERKRLFGVIIFCLFRVPWVKTHGY